MSFTGMQCPDCQQGRVQVIPSNSGGWYYECSQFDWNAPHRCRAAWNQRGEPYSSARNRLKRSFWRALFGG